MKRLFLLSLVSLAVFFAHGQALQLQKPAGGEVWTAFSNQKIQWQSANVDNIKIDVSTDSGRTWSVVQASYPASATFYSWTVLPKPSDSCYIRITDVEDANITSSNYPNNPFRIPTPTLQLDPVGSSSVFGGTALPITWTSSGTRNIRIFASYDNKLSFSLIADNVPAVSGAYNWKTPDTRAVKCFIIIQSADIPSVTDTSNTALSINRIPAFSTEKFRGGDYDGHVSATNIEKAVRLTSPNTRVQLTANSNYTINWSSTAVDQLTLQFSSDSGRTWTNIATGIAASSTTYNWRVLSAPSGKCLVKVLDVEDPAVFDISDTTFIIKTNTVSLISPAENKTVFRGQVLPISWSSSGVSNIKIEYLDGSSWRTITSETSAASETFNWVIPPAVPESTRLRISDANDPAITDSVSKILFKTTPSFSGEKYTGGTYDGHSSATNKEAALTLLTPNDHIQLASAVTYSIIWKSSNVSNIDLAFSADSGRTWQNMVTSYSNTGSYLWTVPGIASTACLIRISSSEDPTLSDQSDSVFTILPGNLNLVTDTVLKRFIGTPMPLQWIQTGIEKVSLSYKTSAGGTWITIKDGIDANQEVFYWTLPQIQGGSVWIKIADYSNPLLMDEQVFTGVFKRIPSFSDVKFSGGSFDGHSSRSNNNKLSILKPAANDTLRSGTTFPITWSNKSVTDSVLLQYSIDSGRTWINIGSAAATSGRYNWIVPSIPLQARAEAAGILDDCMVRAVETGAGNEVVGKSNSTFSIIQSGALPVSIVSLKGKLTGDVVRLEWIAENELNFDRYEIERSSDAVSYHKIGEVKAANLHNYTFDDNANSIESEQVFYRLKKIDRDGQFIYTSVVPIHISNFGTFTVYPNPVSNMLTIKMKGLLTGNVKIQMVDMLGKVVKQSSKKASGSTVSITTDGVSSGTYQLKISYKDREYTQKVIVIK